MRCHLGSPDEALTKYQRLCDDFTASVTVRNKFSLFTNDLVCTVLQQQEWTKTLKQAEEEFIKEH